MRYEHGVHAPEGTTLVAGCENSNMCGRYVSADEASIEREFNLVHQESLSDYADRGFVDPELGLSSRKLISPSGVTRRASTGSAALKRRDPYCGFRALAVLAQQERVLPTRAAVDR
jgi:hypothetical protein